ncbi:MAG: TetR/AcrR family transcriptional regulator, mexJK operon transcriptional repressor [Azoarcus sp.]|nr:TetR/AcrR family transcriptional regulator, mexJK operon transcriptional repressor [Azoarcus sp.]
MSNDTHEHLLEAAIQAFAEDGYRISVDDIARRAGVAKQTLYHHFSGKDELFAEAIKRMADEVLVSLDLRDGDLRQLLLRFAEVFRGKLFGDHGIAFYRMLIAEAGRMPQLVPAVYAAATEETRRILHQVIGDEMSAGRLREDDPAFAADMLLSMLTGMERTRRLLAARNPEDDAPDRAARVVDCFLRAFAPTPYTPD